MPAEQKKLGPGLALPWRWFEVESISTPAKNETQITAKLSAKNGATAIPLVYRVPKGVISAKDLLEAMDVKSQGIWVTFMYVASRIHLPSEVRLLCHEVPGRDDRARLVIQCVHDGKYHDWHRDIDYDRIQLADLADMLKFLKVLHSSMNKT